MVSAARAHAFLFLAFFFGSMMVDKVEARDGGWGIEVLVWEERNGGGKLSRQ